MNSKRKSLVAIVGIALAAVIAIVVAMTAMGGEKTATKPEYQATVASARDRVDYAYAQITKADSVENLIERLDVASVALADIADDVGNAAVAPGFEDLNSELEARLDKFSDALAATADQFADPSSAGLSLETMTSLGFGEWDDVNETLKSMQKKGLEIQLLQRHLAGGP